ncbi:immune inhibitor A domain-containing protein [Actinoplanes awajinensis]|uniref:immune inhibitor A domain-containing protein n=1 Tax=Actinoplanes awajinensis TaxID=135946 RepID=UPI001E39DBB5|nr:immune inhibitor A domain-containing protein [Actinoplanes awajinensis]
MTPLLTSPAEAQQRPHAPVRGQAGTPPERDGRELTRTHLNLGGKALPAARYRPQPTARRAPAATPAVGTVRSWVGLDDTDGDLYRKDYTLRAVGKHIEVWVAKDIAFPAADCRKNAAEVTDAQVADLVGQFDNDIYPKETAAFSTPPNRSGADPGMAGDFTGDGDKTVTLVDNVRDDNYYHFPERPTYIAGFFSAQLNELFDRNVMTIDAYDWQHRLGKNPKNEPTDDLCTSRPARPRMYEGTFAHEWQHLLEYYSDPREADWLNEGLSDYAQTLVGYVDARIGVHHPGYDSHLACYQGFGNVKTTYNANPRECGGPQNSLNLWDEGDPNEVLADYGITYQLMVYLRDRFGAKLLSTLHRDKEHQALAAVQAALPKGVELTDVLHDFQVMTLVDKEVGGPGGRILGVPRERVTAASLRSTVNLENKASYDRPGAAPNGADYIRLPQGLIRTVTFRGAATLPPTPLTWKIDSELLFSGDAPDTDETAARQAEVPVDDPVLRIKTTYGLEKDFDFGYVTVSTDGGRTYQVVAGDSTVKGPLGAGLTGLAADVTVSYDLKAYAGQKVLLGFRYVSDAAVNQGGWHIGQITLGKTSVVSTSLDGWKSPTQWHPVPVNAWHVRLVGLSRGRAAVVPIEQVDRLRGFAKVVAIVTQDDPSGTVTQYAPYTLTVDGVVQPGGGDQPAAASAARPRSASVTSVARHRSTSPASVARPRSGGVARPGAGAVVRPDAGAVARPDAGAGAVARPDAGIGADARDHVAGGSTP